MHDQILGIRRREWPLALLLFGYFFLVITSFWILKPIKKTLFITHYSESGWSLAGLELSASQAELFAKVLNMVVAFVAAALFSFLSDRFRRQQLTLIFSGAIIVGFAAYAYMLQHPTGAIVWSFYLFGDLYNSLMVATFFAFANDSVDAAGAKRMYGVIGLGGVLGGAFGSTFVRTSIHTISYPGWMGVCVLLGLLIVGLASAAGIIVVNSQPERLPASAEPEADHSTSPPPTTITDGLRLIYASRYLMAIVALVGIYEMVSTILDFQFTAAIEYFGVHNNIDIGRAFATTYAVTNWLALAIQLLLTSVVMRRLGVGIALLFLPLAALGGSLGFLVIPMTLTAGALSASDNAFNYSINQSARESLYTVTSREEKYKAKAFIDMFVQRFAKAIAVGLNLLMTAIVSGLTGIRALSLFALPLLILWLLIVRYLGQQFKAREI